MKKARAVVRLFYLVLFVTSFYLLFSSRSGEVHTVWEVMNPLFIPVFFVATFLLFTIIFTQEKVEYKLLFIIVHSILLHLFFVIVFPAQDVSVPPTALGKARLIFDNVIPQNNIVTGNILSQIYRLFREDFQPILSVIFARMFGIDVSWINLLLVPLLWGALIPLAAFLVAKVLAISENISVLASLLVSSFPATIYWGAISVPNSLGYVFFFFSLYFILRWLSSNKSKDFFLMMTFFFVSFLSHFLTGVVAFSLILLAVTLRKYENEKRKSPIEAKIFLGISFVFCASLLPLSLIYQQFFYPIFTYLSLDKLNGLSSVEMIGLFTLGEYFRLDFTIMIINIAGPLLGFIGIFYFLRRSTKQKLNTTRRICVLFLLLVFVLAMIDYRIMKLLMVGIPFSEERVWLFRDFVAVPFSAIVVGGALSFLGDGTLASLSNKSRPSSTLAIRKKVTSAATSILIFVLLSGWITASVYYAYPHFSPLQTTSYALEAVQYMEMHTNEKYIVVGDQWIVYAGAIIEGINNPRGFYFSPADSRGVALFIEMKNNPTNDTLIQAMEISNATIAYFVIEKPRIGKDLYNQIIQQAQQNGLQTYQAFYYKGEEKLRIFYYKKN